MIPPQHIQRGPTQQAEKHKVDIGEYIALQVTMYTMMVRFAHKIQKQIAPVRCVVL